MNSKPVDNQSAVKAREARRNAGSRLLRLFAIASVLASPAFGAWVDSNFYYPMGRKFTLTAAEQTNMQAVAKDVHKAVVMADSVVNDSTTTYRDLGQGICLPFYNGDFWDYNCYPSTASGAGKLDPGLQTQTGSGLVDDATASSSTTYYGYTGYACGLMYTNYYNTTCDNYAPSSVGNTVYQLQDLTGRKKIVRSLHCPGGDKIEHIEEWGCWGNPPGNTLDYPTATQGTPITTGYASPNQYATYDQIKTLINAAISSMTASGTTTSQNGGYGISTIFYESVLNNLTNGVPIASSATASGTGGTGTTNEVQGTTGTFTGTITGTGNFTLDIGTVAADSEWLPYADTTTVPSYIENWVTVSTTSGNLKPVFDFINQINFDVSGYTVCSSSWTLNCGIFGTHTIDLRDGPWAAKYDAAIEVLKWFLKLSTVLVVYSIILL